MQDKTSTLYDRIGGAATISRLVDRFYESVLVDDDIGDYFEGVPMQNLKSMQQEFFSIALGGPGEYSDAKLRNAHHGKGIRIEHFKRFVDILFLTLEDFNIDEDDRYEVISRVNTYVDDIVEQAESMVD